MHNGLLAIEKTFLRPNKVILSVLASMLYLVPCQSREIKAFIESPIGTSSYLYDHNKTTQNNVQGIAVFDYQVVSLPNNGSIDLFGTHYLQRLNDWFYYGLGVQTPLIKGDFGGFLTLDVTLHAQKKIYKDLFIDGGISLGGGGGGSSINQSKTLSGTGGFAKSYIGLGYEFNNKLSVGVNYSSIKFIDSQIDNSQLNFFVQTPLSYSVGSYGNAGNKVQSISELPSSSENIFSLELNNIFQISPTGKNTDDINNLSFQYSHFLNRNYYAFIEGEIGYKGLPLYNHFIHGFGYKFRASPDVNLYSQLGIGSGGFSPNDIDTGSGLLIYPKLSLEYLIDNKIGVSVSGGYLFAPTGTSSNYTAGVSVNYHLSNNDNIDNNSTYKGFRVSIFPQTEFSTKIDGKKHHNINMISTQIDNLINDNWYFATQVSIAYNDYKGYPGYGEVLFGIGLQDKYIESNKFQNFFQIQAGANINGVIVKSTVGTNYSLSDDYALYGQLSNTRSVNVANLYEEGKSFSAYSIGAGLTYRFSLY